MALVRGVIAASTCFSSMLSVSGRQSTNTGTAPRSTKALAVDTKVNEGMMTSSPGCRSASSAAISSAAVHECVISARAAPVRRSSHWLHSFVKLPSPARCPLAWAWAMYQSSLPVM
jgi:hypothetical protein